MPPIISYLEPWEFSPTVLLVCALPAAAYARGLVLTRRSGESVGFWQPLAFFSGVGLMYLMLQTYVDYLSGHMFWVHRLQHLFLHHLAPFLLALSTPLEVMARGTPRGLRENVLLPFWRLRAVQALYGFIQNPLVAPLLFVGLIYFWLTPPIHFGAMLSNTRFKIMNWSMAVDGILFWWLMIAPRRAQGHANVNYLVRILILFWVMILQILPGAYIALHHSMLYDVYDICGRAWAMDPMTDQELGGLITWIPAAMMSVVGILVVLNYILRDGQERKATQSAAVAAGVAMREA